MNNNEYPACKSNVCKCCDGAGVQKRNDGIKIICPACGGTGMYPPPNFIWKPVADYPWWQQKDHWVGDDPNDWHGPPKVIC
jgi:hypothetical protein